MDALCACIPAWYCEAYMRDRVNLGSTFMAMTLAMVRWAIRLALWPVDLTWKALMASDTIMYELMAIGSEIAFLTWIWCGSAHPHQVIINIASPIVWATGMSIMIVDHVWVLRSRDRDLRAMAVMFDVIGYLWLAAVVFRSRFYFGEVFLWVFALMGVIAVMNLRSSQRGCHHGRQ